ncbi:DinB family protein [Aquimarina brevivitae]|uniref:Damage-inducible protein DinB n=1 Tax=Aquimarina brevivitae TaxID=323412 RepID=A0A4V2F4V5_9FLAO|nr:DinB family protein [Aquimarina brevivitae]RZS90639.1 hypothetical protein EV197_3168 [Aquimarina brevivitae]
MAISKALADAIKEVLLQGNWVCNNLKDQLREVNWQQATQQLKGINTIALLTYHINYYIEGLVKVLQGGPLDIKDKFSFDMLPITSEAQWQDLQDRLWNNTQKFSDLTEQLSDDQLLEAFADAKYGTNYRNIAGIINHTYYHLGQIALLKKLTV